MSEEHGRSDMSEFSHLLGTDPTTGAVPQRTLDWLAENLPGGGTSGPLDVEAVQDVVAAMLTEGTGITLDYDDGAGTLTIAATAGGGDDSAALVAHIESDTPHPAYDVRLPSLRLIFENGLV